jgi:hypothetical protein
MRFLTFILAAALCWQSSHGDACAANDVLPTSLLGFIKSGMQLGIKSSRLDSLVTIEIYSDEQFRRAKDVRGLTLKELGEKYPEVADKAAKALANFKASIESQESRNPKLGNFPPPGKPTIALDVDRAVLLCTVLYVGEDYLLVTYASDNSKRQVISKHAIARIRWASDELRFRTSIRSARAQE